MHTLESLARLGERDVWSVLLPADWPLGKLPAVHLGAGDAQRVLKGQRVMAQVPGSPTRVRLYDETARFLGIGAADEAGCVQPRRLLNLAPP
jgi:tRNA pseudouridine55 synthase